MTADRCDEILRVVYKFPIPEVDTRIMVSEGAIVVHVGHQGTMPMLWVEMNPQAAIQFWDIEVMATGERGIGPRHEHLGSVVVVDSGLVWHVYRKHPAEPCTTPRPTDTTDGET